MPKILYIIATPIGNLSDITERALDTIKEVDVLLCEDTRVSYKILERYNIKAKTVSLHQHSKDEKIIALLNKYDKIGYVSDAGTPGISDPGNKLVALAVQNDFEVSPIPGASAIISALSVSGMPTDKFLFLGFMPHKGKAKVFKQIQESDYTIAFYESTHRILKTLAEMKEFIAGRQIVVARELTKKFETIYRGTIDEVLPEIKTKGEFVVIVAGKK